MRSQYLTNDNDVVVEGTEYGWRGLLDNACSVLKDSTLSWTGRMIKDHFPQLAKKYNQNQKIVTELTDIFNGMDSSEYQMSGEYVKHLNDRLMKLKSEIQSIEVVA